MLCTQRLFGSSARLRSVGTRGVALFAIGALVGCRAATDAYGPDAASARASADTLIGAFEQRFTNVRRDPKFSRARMRMARYALTPSKLSADTALWTSFRSTPHGAERGLHVAGRMRGNSYAFVAARETGPPSRVGDSRHVIELSQLPGDNEWRWTTSVENDVGGLAPSRADDIMRALLLSAEQPASQIRADYRAAMPRARTALGRLFTLDSVASLPQADGSTLVALQIVMTDESLRTAFPELAAYVRKYVAPARYRFRLRDRVGGEWFDIQGARSRVTMRFRSRQGILQPLSGSRRAMPDTLTFSVDGFAKFGLFTVGATEMEGQFVHVRSPSSRQWDMRFTKEPAWHLPLISERLLRTPLRRPFEGTGILFRMGLSRAAEGQTLFSRTAILAVRESAILRFLGNLGFSAMSDFAGKVEEEEDRFLAEAFRAMRADVEAMGRP